jgi:C_GCAxxG_C_C family probable redox protein
MKKVENAVACFKEGFNCSQSVLSTYGPEFGLDRETALRLGAAFGAGMGRMGGTCGAVTGAFLVLGLRFGAIQAADLPAKEKTYALVREFARKFQARNGSLICKELLGCDLSTAEGVSRFKAGNLLETHCARFVQEAAEILEELLNTAAIG